MDDRISVIRTHAAQVTTLPAFELVKPMGRHSGFVACQVALASADVDLVLIPAVKATLEGDRGVLGNLDRVLARKGHAVVVVAEGAAQGLMVDDATADLWMSVIEATGQPRSFS